MAVLGMFPGQGSQEVGMGRAFIESSDQAQALVQLADKSLGFPLSKIILEGPIDRLTLTENAQPAILLISTICFREASIQIDAAAGHSLGEYSALVAAGCISFEDAVQAVHKRGRYMQEAVEPGAGKMVAVMGPTESDIHAVLNGIEQGIAEIANLNCPGQTVVAGDVVGIDAFAAEMSKQGAKIIPLNVSAPFHCSLMKPAAAKLAVDLDAITFQDPAFPIYSNVEAKAVRTGTAARELLKRQVCGSVRWTDSIQNAVKEGAITDAVEFGAGGVLTKLLKRIDSSVKRHEVANPEGLVAVKAVLG